MAQLTAFKMPFEELRGKLATKQEGILYSGQEEGARTDTLTAGKKSATNFSKYIVAYRRNGVNRFFIKSNTAINRTTLSVERQGALAFAQALADYILYQGGALLAIVQQLCKAYNEKYGYNQTVRGFVIGQLAAQINSGSQLLGYTLPDYRIPGVLSSYQITNHGISVNGDLFAKLNESTVDTPFDNYINERYDYISNKSPYNTIRMYRDIAKMSTVDIEIQGVEYTCVAPINPQTRQLRQGSRFVNAVLYEEIEGSTHNGKMSLFNVKNGKALYNGKQFTLYIDSTCQSMWDSSDVMPTKLYVNPAEE